MFASPTEIYQCSRTQVSSVMTHLWWSEVAAKSLLCRTCGGGSEATHSCTVTGDFLLCRAGDAAGGIRLLRPPPPPTPTPASAATAGMAADSINSTQNLLYKEYPRPTPVNADGRRTV